MNDYERDGEHNRSELPDLQFSMYFGRFLKALTKYYEFIR